MFGRAALLSRQVHLAFPLTASGTGSGSLSVSFSSAIGEAGHLFTFEFNEDRALTCREFFTTLGLSNITLTHRNVLQEGFKVE